MNEWPTGWYREDKPAAPQDGNAMPGAAAGSAAAGSAAAGGTPGAANDPTVRPPTGSGAAGSGYGAGGSSYAGTATGVPANPWPNQPPTRSAPGRLPPGSTTYGRGGRRPRRPRLRLFLAFLAGLVVILLILVIGGYFYMDGKLTRVNALVPTSNVSSGTNWLISGAPGHTTRRQARTYHIGVGNSNTDPASDTIMLLHLPANGNPPVLVSIPRDSYLPIPGHGMDKINAAYSFGGAPLLVRTMQNITGLTINHYVNIGYLGLVNAVNAVGGVTICLKHALNDQASGVHLKKGCDAVNGKQALAFVRTRHQFATQDLQREQNQRVFIKALLAKMLSPGTLFNPFAVIPAATGSVGALTVDEGTHLKDLISVAFALRNPETTTVPIGNANFLTPAGDAVQWNVAEARQLFKDLQTDHHVPKRLITGSHLAS